MMLFFRFIFAFVCFIVFIKFVDSPFKVPAECTLNTVQKANTGSRVQLNTSRRYRYDSRTLHSLGRKCIGLNRPDNSVLSILKDLNILRYRRKRAGVIKSRYKDRYIDNSNLI